MRELYDMGDIPGIEVRLPPDVPPIPKEPKEIDQPPLYWWHRAIGLGAVALVIFGAGFIAGVVW